MPPLYPQFPWTFRGAQITIIDLRVDTEVLAAALPPEFSLASDKAIAWSLTCPSIGGVGAYSEFMINATATFRGETVSTTPFIYVDNDAAMAAGREKLSLDKRLATFQRRQVGEQVSTDVTRAGVRFASFGMTLDQEGSPSDITRYQRWLSYPATNAYTEGVIRSWVSPTVHRVVRGRGYIDLRPSAADRLFELHATASSAVQLDVDLVMEAPLALTDSATAPQPELQTPPTAHD